MANVTFTSVEDGRVKVPYAGLDTWYINDSIFPYIPNADGTGYIAFFGCGVVRRYEGADMLNLKPSTGQDMVPTPATAKYRINGSWMTNAHRVADGTIVAVLHCEDHTDGGEWNSSGLWTSTDDGYTWTDHGQLIGTAKVPGATNNGGIGLNAGPVWQEDKQRWFGLVGNHPIVSTEAIPLPGTWYAMDATGEYSIPFAPGSTVPAGAVGVGGLPGSNVLMCSDLSFNKGIGKFIYVWTEFGNNHDAHIKFSDDGVTWTDSTSVSFSDPVSLAYPQMIEEGTNTYLVYERGGKTVSGNRNDIIRRRVTFTVA